MLLRTRDASCVLRVSPPQATKDDYENILRTCALLTDDANARYLMTGFDLYAVSADALHHVQALETSVMDVCWQRVTAQKRGSIASHKTEKPHDSDMPSLLLLAFTWWAIVFYSG